MADQCDGESSVTCALSAVSRVFQFSTAKRRETDGVTRFFRFVLRSSTNPHQSFRSVSIRRNSLQRFSSPSFICRRGGRNLGPHYHRHDTSSAESTFANLLPPREEEERATKLRALCLWFHNFRRRDVRRPESIGRGRRDQNLMRSIEDEFRRRPHLYKRGMDREMDELWRRLGNASCRIERISIRLSQIVTMEMNLEKWKRRITRLRIISTIMLMSIPFSKNIQFEDPFNLELISRPTSDRILSIFLHVRAINNENNYRRINQRGITTFVGQRDFNDSRWKKAEHQSPPKRTTLPLTYRCY